MATEEIVLLVLVAVALAVLMVVYAGAVAFTLRDAEARGVSGGLVVLLIYLFGPIAAVFWMLFRPDQKVVELSPADFDSAEDAMSAASSLDQQGDWEEAISLYDYVALRWPEHEVYVSSCIAAIRGKQALA